MSFKREDKLRIMQGFVDSEGWLLLKEELEELIKNNHARARSACELGDTNRLFASEAYCMAIEDILKLPKKLKNENTLYFDRLYKKIIGGA